MALYAMVNTAGTFVAAMVDWDGTEDFWVPPADHTMVLAEDMYCAAGFTWDGTNFVPPPQGENGPATAAMLLAKAGK